MQIAQKLKKELGRLIGTRGTPAQFAGFLRCTEEEFHQAVDYLTMVERTTRVEPSAFEPGQLCLYLR